MVVAMTGPKLRENLDDKEVPLLLKAIQAKEAQPDEDS
jgi:hypothetical protein